MNNKTTAQELADLRAAIDKVCDHVQVLTQAVDALTDEVQWRNNQFRDRHGIRPMTIVTSLPKDPTTENWEVNRLRPEDLPAEGTEATPDASPPVQTTEPPEPVVKGRGKRSLTHRLYFDPAFAALARLIGYAGLPLVPENKENVRDLARTYGKEKMKEAEAALVQIDTRTTPHIALLAPKVRKLCWQLLGPPPEPQAPTSPSPRTF